MSDIQNISITSTQTVAQPKPHTTYTVQGESILMLQLQVLAVAPTKSSIKPH